MPKDKYGNKLTWKEFMARWKKGIDMISGLQQLKMQLRSTRIMLVGIIGGTIITFFSFKNLWWLSLILIGALFNTWMQYIGLKQKIKMLESFEEGKNESKK